MKTVRNIFLPICFAIAGILTACNDTLSPQVDIIQIEGVSWAFNVTTSYVAFGSTIETEELLDIKLPVSEGDLLYMIEDDLQFYHRYSPENGTLLSVSFDTLNAVPSNFGGSDTATPECNEVFHFQLGAKEIEGDDWTYDRYFETPEQVCEYAEAVLAKKNGDSIRSRKPPLLPVA